jgi:hypothetical protein
MEQKQELVDKVQELKKTKWEAFCKKHAARIAYLPAHGGKKSLPVVWIEKIQDWVWVSRAMRRHIERKSKR